MAQKTMEGRSEASDASPSAPLEMRESRSDATAAGHDGSEMEFADVGAPATAATPAASSASAVSVPECAICLGQLHAADTLAELQPCGHLFHAGCIRPWVATCQRARSPQGGSSGSATPDDVDGADTRNAARPAANRRAVACPQCRAPVTQTVELPAGTDPRREWPAVARGTICTLRGLEKKPELNGVTVVVQGFMHDAGRYRCERVLAEPGRAVPFVEVLTQVYSAVFARDECQRSSLSALAISLAY